MCAAVRVCLTVNKLDECYFLVDNYGMKADEKSDSDSEMSARIRAWLDAAPIQNGKLTVDFSSMPELDLAGFRLLIARCSQWKECGLDIHFTGELSSRITEPVTGAITGYLSAETGHSLQRILELYCKQSAPR